MKLSIKVDVNNAKINAKKVFRNLYQKLSENIINFATIKLYFVINELFVPSSNGIAKKEQKNHIPNKIKNVKINTNLKSFILMFLNSFILRSYSRFAISAN